MYAGRCFIWIRISCIKAQTTLSAPAAQEILSESLRKLASSHWMEYMLLLDDDEEDEPKPSEKSGCGCLPMLVLGLLIIVLLLVFGNG